VKQTLTSPARTAPASFLRHATDVASFYGFRPARDIERMTQNRLVKRVGAHTFETVAQVSATRVSMHPGDPVLAYYASPYPTNLPTACLPRESGEFGLQVIGSQESVGEVVMLKTLSAIITEWGAAIVRVRVNAVGDKESQQRFVRELSVYTRKHMHSFDEAVQGAIAANPLSVYANPNDTVKKILSEGPRAGGRRRTNRVGDTGGGRPRRPPHDGSAARTDFLASRRNHSSAPGCGPGSPVRQSVGQTAGLRLQ